MAHIIQQVRDAIVAALTVPPLPNCSNVFLYSEIAQDETRTPYIYVMTADDQNSDSSLGYPSLQDIEAHFEISIIVFQTGDYEATALNIRSDIEKVLFPLGNVPNTLGGKVVCITENGASSNEDESGSKPTYVKKLKFQVLIRHLINQPESFVY